MALPVRTPASRFRRRILRIGAAATVVLLVLGAPFFVNRVEDDLEQRVPAEMAAAGFAGVSATFSGQDGTLRCGVPLDDPEAAVAFARDVWGVRGIELDRSCRVSRAPIVETTTTVAGDATADVADAVAPATTLPVAAPQEVDFDTVADVIVTSPQLSLLAVLIDEAVLAAALGADGPITMFAPTDDAFDALPADAFAKLRADPELLRRVLGHHVVDGALPVDLLVDGSVVAFDGSPLEVVVAGSGVTVGGAAIVVPDITAGNGVVHVVDRVIVPADVDLSVPGPVAATEVVFDGSVVTLSGVVASEVERAALLAAVAQGALVVDDRLTVDPDHGLDVATTRSLAQLLAVMPANLVKGSSGFDGIGLFVSGTYLTEAGRDAVREVADAVGAVADLRPPAAATAADASALEAALNAYVAVNPILFEPGSAVLSGSAAPVLERVARDAQQFAGVAITVEGHTDSAGDPSQNLALSNYRALVVRQALIDLGVPAESITAVGYGSTRPVLVDGVEDKSASRRVEFRVVVTQ